MADIFVPSTMEQYLELRAAFYSGAQSVSYTHPGGAKNVTYRSLNDMLILLRMLGAELGLTSKGRGRTYAVFSKGIRPAGNSACDCCFNLDCRCCP